MDTPPTVLGLADGSLARRMVMEDAPTVSMPAVGDNPSVLPWQTDFRVEFTLPGVGFVFASVMRASDADGWPLGEALPKPWSAYLAVNADESFKGWFATSEEARAAVEERIAARIEAHLGEVSR